MKKQLLIFTIILTAVQGIIAQQIVFEQVLPQAPAPQNTITFCNVSESSIAFADIDGDNDQDVIITGGNHGRTVSKLYTNDGNGNYNEVTGTPFVNVSSSSVAFADVDGDNDQDLLITGRYYDLGHQYTSTLYINDGNGNYTEATGANFEGVAYSSVAFADVDGDNDQDVLITGYNNNGGSDNFISKLYTNDGSGNFTEVLGTTFEGMYHSSVAFADIDNDNDQDVLITGQNSDNTIGTERTKLYINDGNGNFTEATTSFQNVSNGDIAFSDVNGDNNVDVFISGIYHDNYSDQYVSKIYTNDGTGNFTELSNTPFEGQAWSSVAFADIDNDNDNDIMITGYNNGQASAKLFENDGTGGYTEVTNSTFEGAYNSSIAFADVDNDNDADLLVTGENNNGIKSNLYINNGNGSFSKVIRTPIKNLSNSSVAFADIDGDNDQDLLIAGESKYNSPHTVLYNNDGNGGYTEVSGTPFPDITRASVVFGDIDGDNDQDIILSGKASNLLTKVYTNDGTGNFTEQTGVVLENVSNSSIALADIDNDNDQDILITGDNGSSYIAKLYTNDGNGNFTEVAGTNFEGVRYSSIAFADIDGDNDLDVLITGDKGSYIPSTKLYSNDGNGNFTETSTSIINVSSGSAAFSDVDNDNDQDLIIAGYIGSTRETKLYTNNGSGVFTEVTTNPFSNISGGDVVFTDIDGDNDQDVLITEMSGTKLFLNDGTGTFSVVPEISFVGVYSSSVAFSDIDNDNDQDVIITGYNPCIGSVSLLYRNETTQLGIIDDKNVQTFKVYPNPSKNIFYIENEGKKIQSINVFNLQGQEMPFIYNSDSHQLNVNLPSGIYLVNLTIDKQKYVQRLIVE